MCVGMFRTYVLIIQHTIYIKDLYTSATVLLMARLFPKIKQAIGEDYLTESWSKCLSCLSEYQSYSESAKWCFESLSELNKIAFQSNDGK